LELFEEKFESILQIEKENANPGLNRTSVISGNQSVTSNTTTKRRPVSVTSSKRSGVESQISRISRRPGIPLPPTAPAGDEISQKMIEIKLEIERIEDKIATLGGFHCGWSPSDHEDFLRVKTKHRHKTDTLSFLNEILGLVADCNVERIKEHITAHKEYLNL
jgi:hypothetical protein